MLEQKLYTVADVAELTGLTSRTIRNYLKDGILRGKKIGVQWRFTEEDINRLFFEVDEMGRKVLHPEDVISDFLKNTEKNSSCGCTVWDIPCGEAQTARYRSMFLQIAGEEKEKLRLAWEMLEEQGIFRVAAAGETGEMEAFAARVREIEKSGE